jgi:anti-sigma B factor antagonist
MQARGSPAELRVSVFDVSTANLGDLTVVTVIGEADLESAPQLRTALATAIDGGARRVLADLSATTFIDSTTLGVLLGAVKRLRPDDGELVVCCTDPNVSRVFEITLLDKVVTIVDSVEAGLARLRLRAGSNDSETR